MHPYSTHSLHTHSPTHSHVFTHSLSPHKNTCSTHSHQTDTLTYTLAPHAHTHPDPPTRPCPDCRAESTGALWGSEPRRQALVDHLQQVAVLQRRCHSFLVCQLLVHCLFRGMCAWSYVNVHLEACRQGSQQLDFDG